MRRLNIVILWFLLGMAGFCQDPQFSQFYSNPLYLGPSFAGAVEGSRFAAAWRDQWIQATAVFRARSISYDHYFSTFNSGLGVLLFQDVSGTSGMGSTNISLNYSYNFKVYNVWYIRPGLSFSYVEHGFYGDLLFGDEILHLMSGGSAIFLLLTLRPVAKPVISMQVHHCWYTPKNSGWVLQLITC